jgi:hypothetical protein
MLADDLSELLEGDEPVLLSDDDNTPFNPQDFSYTSDPWADMVHPNKQSVKPTRHVHQTQLQGPDEPKDDDGDLRRDQGVAVRSESKSRSCRNSSCSRGYGGIRSLTAGAASDWMPEDEDLSNPWLAGEDSDILEEEREHQQLLELYAGRTSGGAGTATEARAKGQQQDGGGSMGKGSEEKTLAVGGFAEKVPLHEFTYTGWPQVRVWGVTGCCPLGSGLTKPKGK